MASCAAVASRRMFLDEPSHSQMRLSEFTQGRDNNFNLIRFIASFGVLFSHCFALALGSGDAEPLRLKYGVTFGTMAVDVFFITSGFLVTNSLFSRRSLAEFLCARVLRIYPALLVMVFLCVFVLGTYFTTLPMGDYFRHGGTYVFLAKNSTLAGTSFYLPGVFGGNPYKNVVNGSLWTLPCEVAMYATLAILWLVFRKVLKRGEGFCKRVILLLAVSSLVFLFANHFVIHLEKYLGEYLGKQPAQLFFMFYCGAAFYALKDRVRLSRGIFWIAVLLLGGSLAHREAFFAIYTVVLGYIVFFLAYIPAGTIRSFNLIGDYSYGIYIYAYPVQQSVVALRPQASVTETFVWSSLVTVGLAVLSWHLLEKKALSFKGVATTKVRSWLKLSPATNRL
ncbi:MAG: acyltransferase [Verrucomicrobiales bacterium]|nr:MAG: acyltransferase [Verrucomicrobiales bacterium]